MRDLFIMPHGLDNFCPFQARHSCGQPGRFDDFFQPADIAVTEYIHQTGDSARRRHADSDCLPVLQFKAGDRLHSVPESVTVIENAPDS